MPALVAVIRRSERRVLLDPAFGLGDGLVCAAGEEVRLLQTSQRGHLGEQARIIASMLRRSGWKVKVRDCRNLQPRTVSLVADMDKRFGNYSEQIRQTALIAGAALVEEIGEPDQKIAPRTYRVPKPPPPPVDGQAFTERPPSGWYRCAVCGHCTTGANVLSHVTNIKHNDWVPVTRAEAQAYALEATRSASSAQDTIPNGISHLNQKEVAR